MKIQLNRKTGTRLIALPKSICEAKGWNEGDELSLDETIFPGHIVLRKTANARRPDPEDRARFIHNVQTMDREEHTPKTANARRG